MVSIKATLKHRPLRILAAVDLATATPAPNQDIAMNPVKATATVLQIVHQDQATVTARVMVKARVPPNGVTARVLDTGGLISKAAITADRADLADPEGPDL